MFSAETPLVEVISDLMKPDLEERMKIQRIPWLEEDQMEMNDIYLPNRLIEEIKTPSSTQTKQLKDYTELFDNSKESEEGKEETKGKIKNKKQRKKILIKGAPGIGKSTLTAKMVYDWAVSTWNTFALVFFISMKVINPGEAIENIIVDGNITPSLCDEEIPPEKIKKILKENGEKVLLIFEGLDEQSKNDDVMKIIKGQKLRSCNFLVTSRPHGISEIERHFSTVATLEGFTRDEAKHFVEKLLNEKSKIDSVMTFTEENHSIGIHEMWRYPILLLFICILVNDGNLDLCDTNITLNDIYERLLNCLYRRYLAKRGDVTSNIQGKRETLLKLGKIALEGMEKGRLLYSKKEIEEKAGRDAFHYGIIIGYKDRRIIQDLDAEADFLVCFIHQSIQEYLAALYITNEIDRSDRRPEDMWPGVWDSDTILPLPLMLIFALDMAVKHKRAHVKLCLALIKPFNCKEIDLAMGGRFISLNIWFFLTQAFRSCSNLKNLTITQACLPDDYDRIPNLVENLPNGVKVLTFKECRFSHMYGEKLYQNTGHNIKLTTAKPTKQLEVKCINSNVIPARAFAYLIRAKGYIQSLEIKCDNIFFEKDHIDENELTNTERTGLACTCYKLIKTHLRLPELYAFYDSFLYLLSHNLPWLQHLSVDSDTPFYYPEYHTKKQSAIIDELIMMRYPYQPTEKLGWLITLDILPWAFPTPLTEAIVCNLGKRLFLRMMRIRVPFSLFFTAHKEFPVLETLNLSWGNAEPESIHYDEILATIYGSRTLRHLTVNSSWLESFTPLLMGEGLPVLEKLVVIWQDFESRLCRIEIKKAAPCTLPKLQTIDFGTESKSSQIHPKILRQFFVAIQGSLYLTSVDITGQDASGVLLHLANKESLPELEVLKADDCGLVCANMKQLGKTAQEKKLNKLTSLSIAFNPKLAGSLKYLCKRWPSLESIFLHGIRLNAEDVSCLITSCREIMPKLKFIRCSADIMKLFKSHDSEISRIGLHVESHDSPSPEFVGHLNRNSKLDPIHRGYFSQWVKQVKF